MLCSQFGIIFGCQGGSKFGFDQVREYTQFDFAKFDVRNFWCSSRHYVGVTKDDFWVELEDILANVELDGPRDDYDRTRGSSLGDQELLAQILQKLIDLQPSGVLTGKRSTQSS